MKLTARGEGKRKVSSDITGGEKFPASCCQVMREEEVRGKET